jgi:hypothetical protein
LAMKFVSFPWKYKTRYVVMFCFRIPSPVKIASR